MAVVLCSHNFTAKATWDKIHFSLAYFLYTLYENKSYMYCFVEMFFHVWYLQRYKMSFLRVTAFQWNESIDLSGCLWLLDWILCFYFKIWILQLSEDTVKVASKLLSSFCSEALMHHNLKGSTAKHLGAFWCTFSAIFSISVLSCKIRSFV